MIVKTMAGSTYFGASEVVYKPNAAILVEPKLFLQPDNVHAVLRFDAFETGLCVRIDFVVKNAGARLFHFLTKGIVISYCPVVRVSSQC